MKAPVSMIAGSLMVAILQAASIAHAEDAEQPKGWDRTERVADYLEPAIPHPAQQQEVLDRLRQLEAKTGRKPNILIILVDDMGYGDPGAYGGGEMAGAPTPNISLGCQWAEAYLDLCHTPMHAHARSFDDRSHSSAERTHATPACL